MQVATPKPVTGVWLGEKSGDHEGISAERARRLRRVEEPASSTFVIEAPRPLADALHRLSEEREVSISYEEQQPEYPGDLVDIGPSLGLDRPRLARRTVRVEFDFPPEATIEQLARLAVEAHQRQGGIGGYDVNCERSRCFVVQRVMRNGTGARVERPALLDTNVSLPETTISAQAALDLVLSRVSATTGQDLESEWYEQSNPMVTVGGGDFTARTLVTQIVDAVNPGRPWRLLCGPDLCSLDL